MQNSIRLPAEFSAAQLVYALREFVGATSAALMLAALLIALAAPAMEKTTSAVAQVTQLLLSEPEPESNTQPPVQPNSVTTATPSRPATKPEATKSSATPDSQSSSSIVTPVASKALATEAAPNAAVSHSALPQTAASTLDKTPQATPPPTVSRTAVQTERYEAQILRYLESIKRYPSSRDARQTRPAGTVTVWFDLSPAGRVLDAGIEKSSNSSLLDSEALKTVRTGNFPAYPEGVFASSEKHRFSANLSYELKTTE